MSSTSIFVGTLTIYLDQPVSGGLVGATNCMATFSFCHEEYCQTTTFDVSDIFRLP